MPKPEQSQISNPEKLLNAFYSDLGATRASSGGIGFAQEINRNILHPSKDDGFYISFTALKELQLLSKDIKSEFINMMAERKQQEQPDISRGALRNYKNILKEEYEDKNKYLTDVTKYVIGTVGLDDKNSKIENLSYSQYSSLPEFAGISKNGERVMIKITTPNDFDPELKKIPNMEMFSFGQRMYGGAVRHGITGTGAAKNEIALYGGVLKSLINADKAESIGYSETFISANVKEELEPSVKKLYTILAKAGIAKADETIEAVKDVAKAANFSESDTKLLVDFANDMLNSPEAIPFNGRWDADWKPGQDLKKILDDSKQWMTPELLKQNSVPNPFLTKPKVPQIKN